MIPLPFKTTETEPDSYPFPTDAARRLADGRASRIGRAISSDDLIRGVEAAIDDAQLRINQLREMVFDPPGAGSDDDRPTAA